jgi:hypothetical protein
VRDDIGVRTYVLEQEEQVEFQAVGGNVLGGGGGGRVHIRQFWVLKLRVVAY